MAQSLAPKRPGVEDLFSEYSARPAKFSGDELEHRRSEFDSGYGMNRLEGAGDISPIDAQIAELWITGRVTDSEYIKLCALILQQGEQRAWPQLKA